MGKNQKYLIILILVLCSHAVRAQEEKLTYQEVDRKSYELYEKGEWRELISFSKRAFSEGFDYYYLRIRAGVANFETKNYMKAAIHFKEALAFNNNDPIAAEYLYGCYLDLNRVTDAIGIYNTLPSSAKERLIKTLPKLRQAIIETGPLMSNQPEKFDSLLFLDPADSIYGETDVMQSGFYFNAGLSWGFKKGSSVYAGYSLVRLDKEKQVKTGDTLAVTDKYPLTQHQFYASGIIPVGKGYSILPAVNVILDHYETVMSKYDTLSFDYLFPVESTGLNSYIGYLSVIKDFNIIQTGLFAAWSNLNEQEQFQAGFSIVAFPLGNLNLYLSSKLMNHRNEGRNHAIFEQMIGTRLYKPLWAEINATFGQMINYHENNAFVVYNIADKMKFKAGAKLIYTVNPRWMITAQYIYLLRESSYLEYSLVPPDNTEAVAVTRTHDFQNQFFLMGLKWSF
jgi:tetratricopeptide (TPR) repeat protein